ncbi:MAG: DUF4412 domain-containing protein [Bacteroidetes bacterium]|nr:DUF4412 domain-containing protein [Bacteroidota bacterium]
MIFNNLIKSSFFFLAGIATTVFAQPGRPGRWGADSALRAGRGGEGMPFSMGTIPCKFKPLYTFQHNMIVAMLSTSAGGDSNRVRTQYYFNDSINQFAGKMLESSRMGAGGGMISITTLKDSSILMLMETEGKKRGFCTKIGRGMKGGRWKNAEQKKENPFEGATKTGRTKTICGYECEEWMKDDNKATHHFWFTKEAAPWFAGMRNQLTSGPSEMPATGVKGMMLEMDKKDKERHSYFLWQVQEVNRNSPFTISTAGYEIR